MVLGAAAGDREEPAVPSTTMAHSFNSGEKSSSLGRALARLDALVDWERWERVRGSTARMRVDVEPMRALCARLEHPERGFATVHVAGTKGKGSVASMIALGLRMRGAKVGLYTSPHVETVNERIRIDGVPLADELLAEALEAVLDARQGSVEAGDAGADATWFDVLTAASLWAFRAADVDWAVMECGLGGRLDSTNVLAPGACVITNIDLEHTAILGDTRAAIAAEKAGILKPGGFVVSGVGAAGDEAGDVVRAAAAAQGVACVDVEPVDGETIEEGNLRLAAALLAELGARGALADPPSARELAARADEGRLPARMEVLRWEGRPVVLDGAHVASSLQRLLDDCEADPRLRGAPLVVFGAGREKDADRLLKMLVGRVDRVLCTKVGSGPYHAPLELLASARRVGLQAESHASPSAVLARLRELCRAESPSAGWILVTGSLHLTGALRPLLRDA